MRSLSPNCSHSIGKLSKVIIRILTILTLLSIHHSGYNQRLTQTVRGTVLDKQSYQPIVGARVILMESDPLVGAITDINGKFRFDSIAVGKSAFQVTFIGYEPAFLRNVEVGAKEVVLTVELTESVKTLAAVDVTAQKKGEVINKMATVSVRSFSIDESNRFAGSKNDVARMAQNYAGVQGADDSRNDIIVRGNSPSGILYRMEGIDIPNPNHFARFGTTGGPISMLNNNVMANSDFLTGAFPAEYGNATSGVFDLKLRTGNNEKREYMLQLGFNGAEGIAEGPISKKKGSSYLINYRYSTLKLFQLMGINFGSTALPKYQDACINLNFPHKKGLTTLFGIGGFSRIAILAQNVDSSDLYAIDNSNTIFESRMGVVGLTHKYRVDKKSYLRVSVGFHSSMNYIINDTVDDNFQNPFNTYTSNTIISKQSTDFFYNRKINAKHTFRVGLHYDIFFLNLNDSLWSYAQSKYLVTRQYKGNTFLSQPNAQYQWRPIQRLTVNVGIHLQGLALNREFVAEPRAGAAFEISPKDRLSFGYGLHSQLQPLEMYYLETSLGSTTTQSNKGVKFSKSHHLIAGYQHTFKYGINAKFEGYYQYLFDIPVESTPSVFSMVNFGTAFDTTVPDSLVNNGKGRNFGAELTVEKFLDKGFYFLVTTSVYQSYFTPSDGKEYNTAYNGNFTFNALVGYELRFRARKKVQCSMTFDIHYNLNGGKKYTPILLAQSQAINAQVLDYDNAYSASYPNYTRGDVRIGFKMVCKRISQEFALDMQNITNYKNIFFEEYNPEVGDIQTTYQTGRLPIFQYRFYF